MLDLSLFRFPKFVGVQALPIATCYCYVVLLVLLPLRLIGIEDLTELHAGIVMISLSAPMLVVPFAAASLVRWISAGIISAVGLVIAAGGLLWLSNAAPGADVWSFAWPMMVIGLGASMPWGLMDGLSVSVVPKERAGMATGIFSTTRVAGEGVALAITSAVLAAFINTELRQAANGSGQGLPGIQMSSQHLALGDINAALADIPVIDHATMAHVDGNAFQNVLYILASITVASAAIVFALLRNPKSEVGRDEDGRMASLEPAE
ncbi:MFS transporter [Pararhizobium sp. A13]|uniref:MFS transporter n=1 Tax=Pararhizobium sp. A13 TaxID=3133975 RepID=UPI003252275F